MSYIGKEPSVGNFIKLDAITCSSTNTYNLLNGGVAFTPESVNHMLVSLNGVIQSPTTAYTVSGSQITFIPSSGTLSSSDVIDFIMVYGNVLDIGVPSDNTVSASKLTTDSVQTAKIVDDAVTKAKVNFISDSTAGVEVKGDGGSNDGYIQLNCSQNSHGIKLKSPPHSAGASYTLTFPNNDGNADQFLQTDGSGVLSFADAGGGGMDLLQATSITGDISELSYTGFSSTYNIYKVYFFGLKVNGSTNNQAIFQMKNSSGNITSNYYVAGKGTYMSSASANHHNAGQWNTGTPDLNGWNLPDDSNWSGYGTRDFEFTFFNTNSTTRYKNVWFQYGGVDETASYVHWAVGNITNLTTTALTGFRLYTGSGTALENEGKMLVYGVKES